MANELNNIQREINDLRTRRADLNRQLLTGQHQLSKNSNLSRKNTFKNAHSNDLYREVKDLTEDLQIIRQELKDIKDQENRLLNELAVSQGGFARLAEQLDDQYPILFFPVRLETVFQSEPSQLWLRVFPDEIAVETHEEVLSESEVEEGKMYWRQFVDGATEEDKLHAWDLLCRSFSAERAAYIALVMTPTNLGSNPSGDQLAFPIVPVQPDTWSKQPATRVMPDAFRIHALANDGTELVYEMKAIPDELKMGIDPALDDQDLGGPSFNQVNVGGLQNELVADHNVDWMIDFDAAIEKGMGARIEISRSQYERGFKRILVVGVKSTLSQDESKERLEQLLINHHYTDGLSLLKQGTNTNNTEDDYSGFQSVEFGNKTTYQTERLDPLFQPLSDNRQKTDGQILCEALGIEYDTFYHVFRSDGTDIKDVINYNASNFETSVGYVFSDLLRVLGPRSMVQNVFRRFNENYMRSRGALPSIRSGNQPYGILPTSVFSRLSWDAQDTDSELFSNVHQYVGALNIQWSQALDTLSVPSSAGQQLADALSKHAVSTEYVQRIGVGAGYIWNNIEYAALAYPDRQNWQFQQRDRMQNVRDQLGLPLEFTDKALQINYLNKQSNLNITPAFPGANPDKPLPPVSDLGNLLNILSIASFDELRDEDFQNYGVQPHVVESQFNSSMLYRHARQSIMLEFFEAACDILGIPDEQRGENEFVNVVGEIPPQPVVGEMGPLTAGPSRLQLMNTLYAGQPISRVLSTASPGMFPQAANLFKAKEALVELAKVKVGDLDLLVRESIDCVTYRLDVWRLSLVNERLNRLRELNNGPENRRKGIHLGAYGWLEDVKPRAGLVPVDPPGTGDQFPEEIWKDIKNKGYIHAPSMNQAVTGAVMLSGYAQRAKEEAEDPLSVNLSSERVRAALDLMEGVRNGQSFGVLLGYEFERKFRELVPAQIINIPLYNLRKAYPLDQFVVDVVPDGDTVEKIASRNVVNGNKLVELAQEGKMQEIIDASGDFTGINNLLRQSVDWIQNLADAVADIGTTEGIFQIVQGNTIKGGATVNALSKGRFITEPDVVPSTKQGIEIPQRFMMHLDTGDPRELANNWNSISGVDFRVQAEPYINKWLCSLLPDPATIFCRIAIRDTEAHHWASVADLNLHAVDLLYLMGEELQDGDDLLSLLIKQFVRRNWSYDRTVDLAIEYDDKPANEDFSFAEIHPVLLYAQKLLNSARHLNTHDYMIAADIEGSLKIYDIDDLTIRYDNARMSLTAARNYLQTVVNAPAFNKNIIVDALYTLSFFGIEQTVYEFVGDTSPEENDYLIKQANLVLQVANGKLEASVLTEPIPNSDQDPTAYVANILQAFKHLLDPNYVVLPLFEIRPEEQSVLLEMFNGNSTLIDDQKENPLLTEEWMSSIAKVKKNAQHYQFLSILATALDPINSSSRSIVPLQIPYTDDGLDRWLGASVLDQQSIRQGRISMGASVPTEHYIGGYQAGIMVEEWMDVVPLKEQTTGVSFHYDQPNAKAPQCLILGLTPQITGNWQWDDIVDMMVETFDLAKKRGLGYEVISKTPVGQLPGFAIPMAPGGNTIGFSEQHILNN